MMDARFTEETDHPKPKKFTAIRLDCIEAPKADLALIEGILMPRSLCVVYGESGSGKSFLTAHMALCVAASWEWAGKETMPGPVCYVTTEGAEGFRKRMVAAREQISPPADTPFFVICDAPDLGHEDGDATEIIARIKEEVGPRISIMIVDTMARVMDGADENSATDVSVLVANAAKITQALGCAVVLVHHTGKDTSRGARGSSALRAAADTEVRVENVDGGRRAVVTKQKDLEGGLTLAFSIEPVDLRNGDTR